MKIAFGTMNPLLRIADRARLRCEHSGGIVFNASAGTTVDVDRQLYAVLQNLENLGVRREDALVRDLCGGRRDKFQLAKAPKLLQQLLDLGIVVPASPNDVRGFVREETLDHECVDPKSVPWPRGPHLSAPVTVHWAITYRCDASCPECYAQRYAHHFPDEPTLPDALRLVEVLASWGVFELGEVNGRLLLSKSMASTWGWLSRPGTILSSWWATQSS